MYFSKVSLASVSVSLIYLYKKKKLSPINHQNVFTAQWIYYLFFHLGMASKQQKNIIKCKEQLVSIVCSKYSSNTVKLNHCRASARILSFASK